MEKCIIEKNGRETKCQEFARGWKENIDISFEKTWLREENKTFVSYVAVFDENEEWIFIPLYKRIFQ